MKISSTYTIALQILMMIKRYSEEKLTSNYFSNKIGAAPALIRAVMADLKNSGIIESRQGPGGTHLLKKLEDISLYDVYKAVTKDTDSVLKFYDNENKESSFETQVISVTEECFSTYISSFYNELKAHTVADIYNQIK